MEDIPSNLAPVPGAFPRLARLRFHLRALEPIRLPDYAGSAWRGLLGHGLRRAACVTGAPRCEGCLLRQVCAYSVVFETPAAGDLAAKGYSALPHPFVLEPEAGGARQVPPGGDMTLGIALVGPAIDQVPYLIRALDLAGELGLGQPHGRFRLVACAQEIGPGTGHWEQVYDTGEAARDGAGTGGPGTSASGHYRRLPDAPLELPPTPAKVGVCFRTPLRVKRRGHFLGARDLAAEDLLHHLCTRLATLAALYGGDAQALSWYRLRQAAAQVRLEEMRLHWHEWTRFSSRQDTRMQMGGLLGDLTLGGPGLPTFWSPLWYGQWVHVGKGTSFGLGAYALDPS